MSIIVPVSRVTRLTSPLAAWPARLGALILIAPALLPDAQATPIGCTDGVGDSAALIAAIAAANANGGDTLDLGAGCVYGFSAANNFWYGPNALPPIASAITIRGHGARLQATHTDTTAANGFRFFYVSGGMQLPAGTLHLDQLTIADGYARGGDSSFGGSGAAAASRRAVGTPVFWGMLAASLVGIFFIPMLYVTFQSLRERVKGWMGSSGGDRPPAQPAA